MKELREVSYIIRILDFPCKLIKIMYVCKDFMIFNGYDCFRCYTTEFKATVQFFIVKKSVLRRSNYKRGFVFSDDSNRS